MRDLHQQSGDLLQIPEAAGSYSDVSRNCYRIVHMRQFYDHAHQLYAAAPILFPLLMDTKIIVLVSSY